jgi:hypothetical protein
VKHKLREFETVFGLKRDEVTGGWRELHNEQLHNLHISLNITRMIKSRRMRRAGHVACTKFWLESLKGRDHLEDLVTDGRVVLKWILG